MHIRRQNRSRRPRTPVLLLAATALLGTVGASGVAVAATATATPQATLHTVPGPKVSGPVRATAPPGDPSHDYPFFASDQDLKRYGYVEEEYFIEGTANRYTTPDQATGSVIDGGHHYKTRIVVRRPASAKKFNGTAIVEWDNVTNQFDYEVVWSRSLQHMMSAGYVWVGVSAQRAGVHSDLGLKTWNPRRYGDLDLTDGGTVTDDSLSYDVFSQAAKALTAPQGVSPVGGLKVKTLIATGQSQSASRLALYANSVHPLGPVYDGIAIVDGGVQIRPDITTKVFRTSSEYDVINGQGARRQPDTGHYVSWEIAGASHSDRHAYLVNNPVRLRDTGLSGLLAGPTAPCVAPARSNVPYEFVLNAMFDHTVRWARQGVQPPAGPRIQVTDFTTSPPTLARDPYQIVRGGIRLAAVDVPVERNTGWNVGLTDANNSACRQGGQWVPFDGKTLDTLYPTHSRYVQAVRQVTERNVRDGFMTRKDADDTIRAAEHSRIGG